MAARPRALRRRMAMLRMLSRCRALLPLLVMAATLLLAPQPSIAETTTSLPQAERQKIEALIVGVEKLDGAVFVRNGKEYQPATAAKFLRGKWQKHATRIKSAEDFIVKVASASSTTGRVYLVRFDDGREVPTATFLRARLAALR